jgi:glycerol-3-phosphate dehydrogenase (NAD(P)+)
MKAVERVSILGAGEWGSALAAVAARAGRTVTLWARDPSTVAAIGARRESPRLPGMQMDARVTATDELSLAANADAVLLCVPAQTVREVATSFGPYMAPGTPVIACAKGIERSTGAFMTEVLAGALPGASVAILSGPSFAVDVARGLPTAVTLAAADAEMAKALAHALGSGAFRPYHSTDVRGVEIGGAAKNVLAIAAGIVAGRGLGASAAAALTTRGFAELIRFGRIYGAKAETLTGLSGLGDLILTCSTEQSRNFSLGLALGRGQPAEEALRGPRLAEGAFTAPALVKMAEEKGIEMPIARAVADVLAQKLSVERAIESLLTRPFRAEE